MKRQPEWASGRLCALVVSMVVLALVAAGCGSSSGSGGSSGSSGGGSGTKSAQTSCPVKVLLVDNFTGAGSDNGTANLGGANAAIASVNKSGGVLGCPIKLDTKDDASDYTKDLSLLEQATSSTKYAMVINADFGCATTAPYIGRQKLLSITGCALPGVANPKLNPYIFDADYVGSRSDGAAGAYMLKKGYKRVAVIVDNTGLGAGDAAQVAKIVKAGGGTVTDTESVDLSGINFTPAIVRARASKPQVLFIDLFGAALGHVLSDLATSGWKIPVVGGSSSVATNLQTLKVPPAQASSITMVGPGAMGLPSSPAQLALLKSLKQQGVKVNNFLFGYAALHDDITMFAWAANKAKSLDPAAVSKVLENSGTTKIPGLAGGETNGYTPSCHEWDAAQGVAIMQGGYYHQGRLKTLQQLTAPPQPCTTPAK